MENKPSLLLLSIPKILLKPDIYPVWGELKKKTTRCFNRCVLLFFVHYNKTKHLYSGIRNFNSNTFINGWSHRLYENMIDFNGMSTRPALSRTFYDHICICVIFLFFNIIQILYGFWLIYSASHLLFHSWMVSSIPI